MFRRKKLYYREWMSSYGWGVMLSYDVVAAYSKRDAKKHKPFSMYSYDKLFETIEKVKKKHSHMTDEELSKIYGE